MTKDSCYINLSKVKQNKVFHDFRTGSSLGSLERLMFVLQRH